MQPFDRHVAVLVVQRGDHAAQRGDRIGDRPAVRAAVLGDRQDAHGDDAVGDAPHARADRGDTGAVVADVGHDRDIGAQQIALAADQLGEVLGGAFLFALYEDLHGDRERGAFMDAQGAQGRGVDRDAGLVVGGATSVQTPLPDLRFERRALPICGFALGLHVVMGV